MKIIARRQLHGTYGSLAPGDSVEVDDETAHNLIQRGLVYERSAEPARETKITGPEEVKPIVPIPRRRKKAE